MTGEKDKGTTLEKLWKLDDTTLKTPAHDELVLKLLNKDYLIKIIPEISNFISDDNRSVSLKSDFWLKIWKKDLWNLLFNENWDYNRIWNALEFKTLEDMKKNLDIVYEEFKNKYNEEKLNFILSYLKAENVRVSIKWDDLYYLYYDKEKFLSVFDNFNSLEKEERIKILSDIQLVLFGKEQYDYSFSLWEKIPNKWIELIKEYKIARKTTRRYIKGPNSEVPIKNGKWNNFIVGYWDIVIETVIENYCSDIIELRYKNQEERKYYIEVKPKIASFGETLRQLMTYKNYTHSDNIFLFTPDLRFKEAFESQGIKVISPLKEHDEEDGNEF